MKTPLPFLLCIAAFPLFTSGQTPNVASPAKDVQDSDLEALLSKPVAPEQLALRAQEQRGVPDSPSLWSTWTGARWEVPIPETMPTVSLGRREFHASGFMVNAFGPAPADRSWSERVLGLNISHPFVPTPLVARPPIEYFKWGERDEPWSNVGDNSRRGPEGVLLSLHF